MNSFMETANFFEKAENTLHEISQKVCCGSGIPARDYISELKDCLSRIRVLKEEALHMVHCFDDDHGLRNVISSCNELVQLSNQLVAKTEQYLKHFSATAASDDAAAEVSKDSSENANSDMDSDQECDESRQNETGDDSDIASTEPTVENDTAMDHCDSVVTAVSSSPQLPTLADYGITKETLDRLPLLKLTVEPQSSYTSVSQRHPEASLLNNSTHQQQLKTEIRSIDASHAVGGNVRSQFLSTHVIDENTTFGRVPLQSCGNTCYDMFSSPEVPVPVLSSVAQQCLRGGYKPK